MTGDTRSLEEAACPWLVGHWSSLGHLVDTAWMATVREGISVGASVVWLAVGLEAKA